MLGKRHMRAYVPSEALAVLAVNVPAGKGVLLKNLAVFVTEVIGSTQPGQASAQNNDHT